MFVYLSVILFILLIVIFNESINNKKTEKISKITIVLFVLLLGLVAGLRYNVGTDYYNYYASYGYFKSSPLSFEEPGIILIAKLSAFIYDDPAMMMFLASLFTVLLMVSTVLKNSKIYWVSIFLYVFLGSWHGCFNGVRQYLAAAILFSGHRFIIDKKFWKWLVIVFLSSMCHITSVIGIIFYFFPKLKINKKNLILSILLCIIAIFLYDKIFGFIEFLKNDAFDFEGVGSGYLTNSINPLRIIVAWVPTVFFRIFQKYYNVNDKEFKFYSNMSLLHAILMTTAMNSAYLGRVGIYTGIYISLFWPLLLKKVNLRDRKILIFFMMIFYCGYWLYEINGPTLINFKWIFQR